jgi:hypothetical protein
MAKVRRAEIVRNTTGAISALKAVRYSATAGQIELAIADGTRKLCAGFTTYATTGAEEVRVQDSDILGGFAELTPGAAYYLSQVTAGEITPTRPTSGEVQIIGVAISGTELDVDVNFLDLIGALVIKAGTVAQGSFSGNPKKATVEFTTAFANTSYSLHINGSGADVRTWTYESKLAGSFVINSNSNTALTAEVSWRAQKIGEVG